MTASDPRDISIASYRAANAAVAEKTWAEIEGRAAELRAERAADRPLSQAQAVVAFFATDEGRELFERHQNAFRAASPTYA